MNINDFNDLHDFLRSQHCAITAAKIKALRMVAGQETDVDLQQILTQLANELAVILQMADGTSADTMIQEVRLAENFLGRYYLKVRVAMTTGYRETLILTPENLHSTLTRMQPGTVDPLSTKLVMAATVARLQQSLHEHPLEAILQRKKEG
jgi:hypothetical protein